MKTRAHLICLITGLGLMILHSKAQTFHKTYGEIFGESVNSIQQTSDGGYIMAGETSNWGAGSQDVYLIKTDANGDTLWTKVFGGSGQDFGEAVQQTTDGGYIICGSTLSFGMGNRDGYLIKTDANGVHQWSKTYGGTAWDGLEDVHQTTDGGYILGGTTYSYGAGSSDAWLIKTDGSGNASWANTFSSTGVASNYEYGNAVRQTTDGGYILAGEEGPFNQYDLYLIKTNSSGNLTWSKSYGGASSEVSYDVQQTTDGGYVICGRTASFGAGNYDVYVVKTNSSGVELWSKTYGGVFTDYAYAIQQTTDGGYIVAGFTDSNQSGAYDIYVIKTNSNGDTLWTSTYGGTTLSTDDDQAYSVWQTTGGGYVLAGNTQAFGEGSSEVYLIKTDASGNSGACHQGPSDTDVANAATIETTLSSTQGSGSITLNPATLQAGTDCVVNQPVMTLSLSSAWVTCNGGSDGEATVTTSGGISPFIYQWDANTGNQTTPAATGLPAGNYFITVVDAGGCAIVGNVTVTEPATPIATAIIGTNVICSGANDGSIDLTVTGGIGTYAYSWSTNETTEDINNLVSGTYYVTVTDSLGCTSIDSVTISDPNYDVPICLITVDSTSTHNLIVWEKPPLSLIDSFRVYRDIVNNYTWIGTVPYDSLSVFIDSSSGINPNTTSYRYVISVVDSCGVESDTSAFHETMHLTSNLGTNQEVNLIWDTYEGFSLNYYRILRDSTGTGNYQAIDSVSSTNFTYTDWNLPNSTNLRYVIEVIPPAVCVATRAENYNSARSNVSASIDTKVHERTGRLEVISVYPNPSQGHFNIELMVAESQQLDLQIFNIQGQLIQSERYAATMGKNSLILDMTNSGAGIYQLNIGTRKNVLIEKLIVQ